MCMVNLVTCRLINKHSEVQYYAVYDISVCCRWQIGGGGGGGQGTYPSANGHLPYYVSCFLWVWGLCSPPPPPPAEMFPFFFACHDRSQSWMWMLPLHHYENIKKCQPPPNSFINARKNVLESPPPPPHTHTHTHIHTHTHTHTQRPFQGWCSMSAFPPPPSFHNPVSAPGTIAYIQIHVSWWVFFFLLHIVTPFSTRPHQNAFWYNNSSLGFLKNSEWCTKRKRKNFCNKWDLIFHI